MVSQIAIVLSDRHGYEEIQSSLIRRGVVAYRSPSLEEADRLARILFPDYLVVDDRIQPELDDQTARPVSRGGRPMGIVHWRTPEPNTFPELSQGMQSIEPWMLMGFY